jgi:hypothetical protein
VESEFDARRRPNPGYRVAPPVTDAFAPWVSVLDEELGAGEYRWVRDADGVLVPTPVDEAAATVRPARRWWTRKAR